MSVRVELRVIQFCGNPFLKSLRDEVLQAFRFVMDFIPGIAKDLVQKRLYQPVMPHNLKGAIHSCIRQSNPMMLFINQ